MKNQKQKIYILLATGLSLFFTVALILVITLFNSTALKKYKVDNLEVANITTQQADIFWKGFSEGSNFKILYKNTNSTGAYKEIIPNNIYTDYTYPTGYMYSVQLSDLNPNESYLLELWHEDIKLVDDEFTTKKISDEIEVPKPISGDSFQFDWIKITNNSDTFILQTDYNGSWVIDKNLIGEEYDVEIYASSMVKENNPISSYLIPRISASEKANCDEITYSAIPSKITSKAVTFENLLKLNGGAGGNPQYVRCYQDAYCEAEKYGVNGQWTLADWAHESNASDYEFPGQSLYEDFGVHCCGVPKKNFQAQLGFFLSLTHDPCNLGSSGTKEQYYCCWANNYLNGSKSTQCTDQTRSYLNGLMAYYYWVSTSSDPGTFEGRLSGLPSRIKTSPKNVSCGPTDPVDVYENDGEIPDDGGGDSGGGICCTLKISDKDDFRGDWEDVSNKSCSQLWQVGREVYGGKIQYSEEISVSNRASCERWWDGVCCNSNGKTEWLPSNLCSKRIPEYTDYNSCTNGDTPDEEICCKDSELYEWKYKGNCQNVAEAYETEYQCEKANGREVSVNLNLKKGYNFIAWNASDPTNPMLASKLFENLAVILIATFRDGVWNKIMYRENEQLKGPDFNMVRGEAYLITTTSDFNLSYSGRTFTEFSWENMKGWQYVPAQSLDPYYNTKSVVLSFDTVDVSQVGLWDKELGKFNYYVYDEGGSEFGESVRLNDDYGVFVKID